MSDAKGFDVKIVYVCVLNATESRDTLHDFISNGGWNCLSKWLESFILTERHAAIRELLKCFQKLPITHRTLSTQVESKDLPGKMIRGLRKHADEEIKSLAGSIYKSWMDMVDEGNKKKAKRKQEKADQTQTKKSKSEKSGPVCKFLIKVSLFRVFLHSSKSLTWRCRSFSTDNEALWRSFLNYLFWLLVSRIDPLLNNIFLSENIRICFWNDRFDKTKRLSSRWGAFHASKTRLHIDLDPYLKWARRHFRVNQTTRHKPLEWYSEAFARIPQNPVFWKLRHSDQSSSLMGASYAPN